MNNHLISVIVPVYNCEKYLEQCIESIINQSYTNIEIIVIDNMSIDNSLNILNIYAEKDSRIKVFSCDSAGVSYARNLGLKKMLGDYVVFIDSDDYVLNDYISTLYTSLISSGVDMIMLPLYLIKKNIITNDPTSHYYISSYASNVITLHDILLNTNVIVGFPFCKIFSANIIKQHNIEFPTNIQVTEDLAFLMSYMLKIDNFSLKFIDNRQYVYRKHKESLTKNKNKCITVFTCIHYLEQLYIQNNVFLQYEKSFYVSAFNLTFNFYKSCKTYKYLMTFSLWLNSLEDSKLNYIKDDNLPLFKQLIYIKKSPLIFFIKQKLSLSKN